MSEKINAEQHQSSEQDLSDVTPEQVSTLLRQADIDYYHQMMEIAQTSKITKDQIKEMIEKISTDSMEMIGLNILEDSFYFPKQVYKVEDKKDYKEVEQDELSGNLSDLAFMKKQWEDAQPLPDGSFLVGADYSIAIFRRGEDLEYLFNLDGELKIKQVQKVSDKVIYSYIVLFQKNKIIKSVKKEDGSFEHTTVVQDTRLLPDYSHFYATSEDHFIYVNGNFICEYQDDQPVAYNVKNWGPFSLVIPGTDGKYITTNSDNCIIEWSLNNEGNLSPKTLGKGGHNENNKIMDIQATSSGRVYYGDVGGNISYVDGSTPTSSIPLCEHDGAVEMIKVMPSGRIYVSGDNSTKVYDGVPNSAKGII